MAYDSINVTPSSSLRETSTTTTTMARSDSLQHRVPTSNPSSSHSNKNGWPVRVYRQVKYKPGSNHWERMKVSNPRRKPHRRVMIKAIPGRGSITIPRIQVRVRLTLGEGQEREEGKEACSNCNNDETDDCELRRNAPFRMTLTRRGEGLLVASNQKLQLLLLRFRSRADCLAFSDQLAALNPIHQTDKVKRQELSGDLTHLSFYVARLLHDSDFMQYCCRLEQSLLSTHDGRLALQSLASLTTENTKEICDRMTEVSEPPSSAGAECNC